MKYYFKIPLNGGKTDQKKEGFGVELSENVNSSRQSVSIGKPQGFIPPPEPRDEFRENMMKLKDKKAITNKLFKKSITTKKENK